MFKSFDNWIKVLTQPAKTINSDEHCGWLISLSYVTCINNGIDEAQIIKINQFRIFWNRSDGLHELK